MLKLAIVTELFHPNIGGVEVRFKELAKKFVYLGYEVHIYTIGYKTELPSYELFEGLHIHRIITDNQYYVAGKKGRKIATIVKFTFQLRKYVKSDFKAIIFGQWPLLPSIFSCILTKKDTITCLDFVEYRSGSLFFIIQYLLFHTTNKISFISENIFLKSQSVFNKLQNAIVIPSSFDDDVCMKCTSEYFLFIGRLEFHKHPEDAIKTVLLYNQVYNSNYELHIIGDGKLFLPLKNEYAFENKIKFHGFVSEQEKIKIISKGKILILPSEREGLPMSIIECLGCGIPTLTTDYKDNGAKEFVISNKIGLVAAPSIQELVQKLKEMITSLDEYSIQCNNIRSNYSLKKNANKYLNYLLEV